MNTTQRIRFWTKLSLISFLPLLFLIFWAIPKYFPDSRPYINGFRRNVVNFAMTPFRKSPPTPHRFNQEPEEIYEREQKTTYKSEFRGLEEEEAPPEDFLGTSN